MFIGLSSRPTVQVTKEGRVLGVLGVGDLVGSALLLSGAPPEVDAITVEPSRTLRWDVGTLQRYLDAHPETRIVLQRHLAHDLASKLERTSGERSSYGR
jgi:CRP-like cAMP-binding protein